VDRRLVDACATAALKLGGPGITRLGITSALRGEGKTTVALAMAALQTREFSRRALLIDADFENPTLGGILGFAGEPGLAEVTTGELSIDTAVREFAEGVAFLPAGLATKHRSRLVRELFSTDLLDELSGLYEVAIVDLPPLLGTVDGPLLAAHFQKALLVVRAQVTPLSQIVDALGMLSTPPYVLVNGVDSRVPRWLSRLVDHR
jgi:tyrosine-protein kinase Etk/Wzc